MKDKFKVETFLDSSYKLAEGPNYDSLSKNISWVDIDSNLLCIMDQHQRIKEIDFKVKVGAAIPMKKPNAYFVCGEKALYTYEDGIIKEIYNLNKEYLPFQRSNDAKADLYGRVWFSATVYDGIHANESKLFCYSNREVICMDPDLKLGNGIAWNKKNDKMYLSDSGNHCIFIYDYDLDTGYISNRKVLCKIDGIPDGLTIDNDDNLWIAIWDGSRIEVRSGKTGILKKEIEVPTRNVTSCAFITDNYDSLLITTAKSSDSNGGKLYKLKVDAKGKQENYAKID